MSNDLTFRFSHVGPEEDRIKVYLPADLRDDFKEFLHEEGCETSDMAEFAFGVDDAILAIALVGGFRGFATLMEKYFSRHQHKTMVVKAADVEFELSGMSPREMKAALETVAEKVQDEQRRDDDAWRAIQREMPSTPQLGDAASDDGDV